MIRLLIISLMLFSAENAVSQPKKDRAVVDNNKKFLYSDSSGVTRSYIAYFGDTLPVPALTTIEGKHINQADLKGKTVVYNFWFVACKPCVAEIPALNKLVKKYQSDSIAFIAITFDKEERISSFLKTNEFSFQIASLPQAVIANIKQVALYPFTAIVNRQGKISFAIFGRPLGVNPDEAIFKLLSTQVDKALQ